jgi:hypothetical protein
VIYPGGNAEFTYYDPAAKGQISTTLQVDDQEGQIAIALDGEPYPHILRVHLAERPKKIMLNEMTLMPEEQFQYDPQAQKLIIKTSDPVVGLYTITK